MASREARNFIFRPLAALATLPTVDLAEYKARRPRRDQASLLVLAFVCSIVAHIVIVLAWEFRAHLPHLEDPVTFNARLAEALALLWRQRAN